MKLRATRRAWLGRRPVRIGLALLCLLGARALLEQTNRIASERHLFSRDADDAAPPEFILTSSLLGGFRGVFITALWMRTQKLKEEGKFYEMVDLYRAIALLQPTHAAAWRYQAWDLAYNVSSRLPEGEERVFWVFRGIDLLRKEAVPHNRGSADLCWELAWFYHHKIGGDADPSFPLYRAHLARQVEDALRRSSPDDCEALTAIAGTYAREAAGVALEPRSGTAELRETGRRIETTLGMDPREMAELCRRFGGIDWRKPAAHSLYWATRGERLRRESGVERGGARYLYLLLRAAPRLALDTRDTVVGDLEVFDLPEYDRLAAVLKYASEVLAAIVEENEEKRARGMPEVDIAGLTNMLEQFAMETAIAAWIDGQELEGTKLLAWLAELTGRRELGSLSLDVFAPGAITRTLEQMSGEEVRLLLDSLALQALYRLGIDDVDGYRRRWRRLEIARARAASVHADIADSRVIATLALDRLLFGAAGPAVSARVRERARHHLTELAPELLRAAVEGSRATGGD